MDENTPPSTMVHTQDQKKLIGGSPSIRSVLSPSNKVNIMQSNDNEGFKKSMTPLGELSKSPVCSQQVALCRYAMSPEDADQWAERVSAITDNDHRDYFAFAAEVIHDILKSLPVFEEVIQADSDDDEIQFQPRTTLVDETTESSKVQKTAQSPATHRQTNPPQTALSPSHFKDVENIFEIDDDSVLSSMTKRLGSPCKFSPLKSSDTQGKDSKPQADIDSLKSRTEISNSPAAAMNELDEILDFDPFASKSTVMNSPVKNPQDALQQAVSELDKGSEVEGRIEDELPDCLEDADTFSSKPDMSEGNITVIENLPEDASGLEYMEPPSNSETSADESRQAKSEDTKPSDESVADPFKPKTQIANTPEKKTEAEQAGYRLPENLEEVDPFKTKSQVCNSPVQTEETNNTNQPEKSNDADLFKSKTQTSNSQKQTAEILKADQGLPENLDDVDPFKPKSQIVNSPVKPEIETTGLPESLDDVDPFKTKSQVNNSPLKKTDTAVLPENLDEIDPFKPKQQMMNSPVKQTDSPQKTVAVELPENLDDIDPFKPKKQMMNSPVKSAESLNAAKALDLPDNLDEIDPFKPKKQMMNSSIKPDKELTETPTTFDLPENLDEVDPFKPKKQMMNSPVRSNDEPKEMARSVDLPENLDEIDPFKPKKQMMNSPVRSSDEPKEMARSVDLPENLDEIDPFKPKKQMMNSPIKSNNEPSVTTETVDLPDNLDEVDPFQPKKQMVNSPVKTKETPKPDDLPDNLDEIDPFKPKKQMENSPIKSNGEPKDTLETVDLPDNLDDIDPFKPKKQMMNSPLKSNNDENKTETVELPDNLDEIDPFKPKKQMMNSPAKPETQQKASNQNIPDNFDDMDPFKSKAQIKSSPPAKTETVDKQSTQQPSVDPFDNLDAFNPFQNMGKTNITPSKNNNMDLLMGFGGTPKSDGGIDLGNNLMCMIAPDKKTQVDNMSLADADFRPANEVFSDPNVWDMLEKFGSSNNQKEESELARMSLYVKFDPLVDSSSSPANSKQQAASAKCLQRMEVVRDGDESIMLMGTPPKTGGRRRSILVQRRPPTSVSSTIYEEDTEKKPTKPHIVDLMLCCEDEIPKVDQDQKPPTQSLDEFSEVVEVLKYSETDMKRLLDKQKKQLTMEFQGRHLAMEQKYTTELRELKDVKSRNKDMMQVVSEYEKLINELITARETKDTESKEVIAKLKSERDQAQNDLNVLENCFSDLLKRFEKAKGMLAGFKTNEEALKAFSQEQVAKLKTKDEQIAKLKSQAETKLKQILEAKEKEKTSLSAEVLKLQSAQKRSELKLDGLEKELEQKRKENAELTDLCDALIAKVGGS